MNCVSWCPIIIVNICTFLYWINLGGMRKVSSVERSQQSKFQVEDPQRQTPMCFIEQTIWTGSCLSPSHSTACVRLDFSDKEHIL